MIIKPEFDIKKRLRDYLESRDYEITRQRKVIAMAEAKIETTEGHMSYIRGIIRDIEEHEEEEKT